MSKLIEYIGTSAIVLWVLWLVVELAVFIGFASFCVFNHNDE